MIMLLLILATVLCLPYALWVFYVAVMRLKMVRDAGQLTPASTVFGYVTLFVGLVLDTICNTLVASLIFWEWPKLLRWSVNTRKFWLIGERHYPAPGELTVSGRLTRLSNGADGWRKTRALAFRMGLLDNIDPAGVHKG